jgi:hypothetical protein
MKYHGSIEFALTIQKATIQLVRRLDIAEFKAKSSGMISALSLMNYDKRNFTFC